MMLVEAPILRAKRVMMEPDTKTKEKELKRLKILNVRRAHASFFAERRTAIF